MEPAIPAFLGKLDTGGRRATRLDLANWLVSPQNPLTARVFVNRLWRQFFGTGHLQVARRSRLAGRMARRIPNCSIGWPPNSCIREWNAAGAHDWDVRHIIRTIVTSHTYRQSSLSNAADSTSAIPTTACWRARAASAWMPKSCTISRSRSPACWSKSFGGPSVKPYQPDGYLAALNFPKREYSASRGDDLYRRGSTRTGSARSCIPALLNFDAPTREECTVNRVNSNTPLQALDLLNDPIFVEAARVFAQNIVRAGRRRFDGNWTGPSSERWTARPTAEERQILDGPVPREPGSVSQRDRRCRAQLLSVGEAPCPRPERPNWPR